MGNASQIERCAAYVPNELFRTVTLRVCGGPS